MPHVSDGMFRVLKYSETDKSVTVGLLNHGFSSTMVCEFKARAFRPTTQLSTSSSAVPSLDCLTHIETLSEEAGSVFDQRLNDRAVFANSC